MPTLDSLLRAEFGEDYENLVGTLPENTAVEPYSKRSLTDISMVVLHHTEAGSAVTWQAVARYHTTANQWNKIGYHIGIRDHGGRCMVSLLNLPETRSYHAHTVGNNRGLAVCVAGRKDVEAVTAAELDALERTVNVIRRWATWRPWILVNGHGDVPGNDTTCPGRYLNEVISALNEQTIDDKALAAAIWQAAKGAQAIAPNPGSAIELFMAEQGYQRIGNEVDVVVDGVWQGITALGYYPGGNANGVAFFATNRGVGGQWGVHMVEAP